VQVLHGGRHPLPTLPVEAKQRPVPESFSPEIMLSYSSATDLFHVFEGKRDVSRIEHHLRRLTRLEAVAPSNAERAGAGAAGRPYRLLRRPKHNAATP
jgi:hypothetical protein